MIVDVPLAGCAALARSGRRAPFPSFQPAFGALAAALFVWEAAVRLFEVPTWALPAPSRVAGTLVTRFDVIWPEALVTATETLAGFAAGVVIGVGFALLLASSRRLAAAIGPLLVVSQAMPLVALAPLIVIWLGFGIASKIATATLAIFFCVTAAFHEGLRRTEPGLVDLSRLYRASPVQVLLWIRVPAALPSLAAGLKLAAAYAPLGAIAGEWVGAGRGLGVLMLHANARMQTDMVFAALVVLVAMSLLLWGAVGVITRRLLHFAPDTVR